MVAKKVLCTKLGLLPFFGRKVYKQRLLDRATLSGDGRLPDVSCCGSLIPLAVRLIANCLLLMVWGVSSQMVGEATSHL
jgi:hypothetical protein